MNQRQSSQEKRNPADRKDNRNGGYLTVEASYLFPIIFFIILAIFYLSMYLSDKAKAQAVVDTYARNQAICLKEYYELGQERDYKKIKERSVFYYLASQQSNEERLTQLVKKEINQELLLGSVEQVQAKISYCSIDIEATVAVNIGISHVKEYFTGCGLCYQVCTTVPVHNPEEFVRAYTQVQKLLDQESAFAETKEKIQEIETTTKKTVSD